MPRIRSSTVISAPSTRVWSEIRDFGSHKSWLNGAVSIDLTRGDGTTVGAIRTVSFADGRQLQEVLTALDDENTYFRYVLTGEIPMPAVNIRGTVRLHSITNGDASFIEWSVTFDTWLDKEESDAMKKTLNSRLATNLDLLAHRYRRL